MDFSQFFKDGDGALSQMRLCVFMVVCAILVVFLSGNVTNMITALTNKATFTIVDFAPQMIWALGIVLTGKAVQSATAEKK